MKTFHVNSEMNNMVKKTIGEQPSEDQSMQILWNVLDSDSQRIAMADKLHSQTYEDLTDHIDMRYRIVFCYMVYKATTKDDPVVPALIAAPVNMIYVLTLEFVNPGIASAGAAVPSGETDERYESDRVKGDGKCNVCGGDGHFARDCPSSPPIGLQSAECHGCIGRGHLCAQCLRQTQI